MPSRQYFYLVSVTSLKFWRFTHFHFVLDIYGGVDFNNNNNNNNNNNSNSSSSSSRMIADMMANLYMHIPVFVDGFIPPSRPPIKS